MTAGGGALPAPVRQHRPDEANRAGEIAHDLSVVLEAAKVKRAGKVPRRAAPRRNARAGDHRMESA
jgi:hypothetical protein